MKRRTFIGASAGAALTGLHGCKVEKIEQPHKIPAAADKGTLGGLTLEELGKQYRYDLFDDFLAFLDSFVIDHEYGGFMCTTDRSGKNLSTSK